MSGKRLIVLTSDLPYPPTYGHKVDQYQRWRGFAARGWRLRLVCWRSPLDPPASAADVDALRDVFEAVDVLPIAHSAAAFARRLARLWRYPSHVAARVPDATTHARLIAEARAFDPAAIVLDGIYGGVAGEALARACGVPVIVRGHNIEHRYFAQQAGAARDLRSRGAWTIARLGLERYEAGLIGRAAWTFDISADDVAYWQRRGIARVSWAPTVFSDDRAVTILPPADKRWDVAYIGNLRLPNNLRGIAWFVGAVMPRLRALRPGICCVFAGADPSPAARALFAGAPDITLIANAPSADAILANGRVLVNPILSGSGVNVKSIDMLRYDAPIVTTAIGARGFGPEVAGQFRVHDDPARFAEAVIAALADPYPPAGRSAVRRLFGEDGIAEQTALIARVAGI
ncbi:glycosyltransferase [Sphingomonas sp. H39-1-10]|uniref:glycosyltransferase n=1 Tax=Sphingomonas pollutisoli TaxID=3030829 RepID=UPI0023B9355F|nr:glycosyltransferase [Sphingomonas pollutisoli]MDF0490653.1 glycosyltransferase [Sphingomonas pollutisoli]